MCTIFPLMFGGKFSVTLVGVDSEATQAIGSKVDSILDHGSGQ